jgi:hypothetical protein
MKNWVRSNWAAGGQGKRQVIIAGMLVSTLVGGVSCATWDTLQPATRYRIVIQGADRKGHFFTTLAVASPCAWQARPVAVLAAKKQGIDVVRVEEIEATGPAPRDRRWGVLKAPWSKIYFPHEHQCKHEHGHGHKHEDGHEH